MARKRMISPEIWESSSFSKLSDFAKLIFIGLISNADDSGKGKASPSYIRSRVFPNDEDRRVTDIKKALSEIALNMSITFYEVEGDSFYLLTNWSRWQKIDRPTPSKIPDPPQKEEAAGERGRSMQNQKFEDNSTNTRRGLDEGSSPNRIERNKNRIEKEEKYSARAREDDDCFGKEEATPSKHTESNCGTTSFTRFIEKWHINTGALDNYSAGKIAGIDWDAVSEWVAKSSYLQQQKAISFYIRHAKDILDGEYFDYEKPKGGTADDSKANRFPREGNFWDSDYAKRKSEEYEELMRRLHENDGG